MNRPTNYTIAALLQLFVSAFAIITSFKDMQPGSEMMEAIPLPVLILAVIAGALGLVSVYGIWNNQRWGVILAIATRAVDGLLAAPGILFAPTTEIKMMAGTGVVLSVIIIVLLLWPRPRALAA